MRQNMAAAAAGREAADLGFGGPESANPRAGPRESERRRPNCAAAEGGSDRDGERIELGSRDGGDKEQDGGARTHAHAHAHERMKKEHAFLFVFVSFLRLGTFDLGWIGNLGLVSACRGHRAILSGIVGQVKDSFGEFLPGFLFV